jgi:hypothetical protein
LASLSQKKNIDAILSEDQLMSTLVGNNNRPRWIAKYFEKWAWERCDVPVIIQKATAKKPLQLFSLLQLYLSF